VGRISDYADAVNNLVDATEMPPFLDGTWQPSSTTGPLRWLGGAGDAWPQHERDNLVLTTCAKARRQVLALQTAVDWYGEQSTGDDRAALSVAWRELLLGQVSDARGVNPWWGEVAYGLQHCEAAGESASTALQAIRSRTGSVSLHIDVGVAGVVELDHLPGGTVWHRADPPIQATVAATGDREVALVWSCEDEVPDDRSVYKLEVAWSAVPSAIAEFDACRADRPPFLCDLREIPPIVLHFPRAPAEITYRPALGSEVVTYDENDDFSLHGDAAQDGIWTTGADGLVGVDSGYLIKETTAIHLAIGWRVGEPIVEFRDEVLQPRFSDTWIFYFTRDKERAEQVAAANLAPTVIVSE
jgi:hypothetical protein